MLLLQSIISYYSYFAMIITVFLLHKKLTKTGQEIASYYWISRKTPTNNIVEECSLKILVSVVKIDIVESCEITATVAPSAGWNCSGENTLCYTAWHDCRLYGKSLFVYKHMTVVIVVSIFLIVFCVYSVIFCIKMVELSTLAWTDIVSGNIYSIIYVD